MKRSEIMIPDFGGQYSNAYITKRTVGSVFVRFTVKEGYGGPCMELDALEQLIKQARKLQRERK